MKPETYKTLVAMLAGEAIQSGTGRSAQKGAVFQFVAEGNQSVRI